MATTPQDSTPDIIVTGKPLPRLHASPESLGRLKGYETGGVWDGKRLTLLPHGTPALAAYPDSGGVWTIGWGATGPDIFKGVRWNLLECSIRFEADVMSREASLRAMLRGSPCLQNQFEALLFLTYNAGVGAVASSTLLKLHRAGDTAGAAAQFLRWNHAGGQVNAGLTDRCQYEHDHYLGVA